MAYVYAHVQFNTGKVFYIGVGADSTYHERAYSTKSRSEEWLRAAYNGYDVAILVDDISWNEALKKEVEYIAKYKRVKDGGTLVNKTKGGDASIGWNHSEEALEKIKIASTGRKQSEKSIEITKSLNKQRTVILLDTATGIYYEGYDEAETVFGIPKSTIASMVNGHMKNRTSLTNVGVNKKIYKKC
jgi:hypothetical protein